MNDHPERRADARLSTAYRELAQEKTPAALDAAVLDAARHSLAAQRLARAPGWIRHLAWAASIGLCLAIVLQVSVVPEPAPPATDARAAAVHQAALESRAQKQGDVPREKSGGAAIPDAASAPADSESVPAKPSPSAAGDALPCARHDHRPDDWLACIETLETGGDTAAAAAERRRFDAAYPEHDARRK